DALCQKLIDRFPVSTLHTRQQLSFWKDAAWDAMLKEGSERLATHLSRGEASEGMAALGEKRDVDYRTFRSSAHAAQKAGVPGTASTNDEEVSRSCYSCGAQDVPASFSFCGICGTKLV